MKYQVTAQYDALEGESYDVTLGRLMAAGLEDIDLEEVDPKENPGNVERGRAKPKRPETHSIEVSDDPPPATSEGRYCQLEGCPIEGDHLAHDELERLS